MLNEILIIIPLLIVVFILSKLIGKLNAVEEITANKKNNKVSKRLNQIQYMKKHFSHLAFECRKIGDEEMKNEYLKYYDKYDKMEKRLLKKHKLY